MRPVTLVALYGDKPPALAALLAACQRQLAGLLGERYRPYPPEQVHATLVGLEHDPQRPSRHRLLSGTAMAPRLDRRGLVRQLVRSWQPLRLRFGGFGPTEAPFTSRLQPPYLRSFSVQGPRAVLIGWPACGGQTARESFPGRLETLRREASAFGIRHAYHSTPEQRDNDGYLRLGLVHTSNVESRAAAEDAMRLFLARRPPLYVTLTLADLALVRYVDESLPHSTSEYRRLSEDLGDFLG